MIPACMLYHDDILCVTLPLFPVGIPNTVCPANLRCGGCSYCNSVLLSVVQYSRPQQLLRMPHTVCVELLAQHCNTAC